MRPIISLVKKLPLQCGSCVLCTRKCSSPVQQTSSIVKKCIPNTESDLCSTACSSPVQDISSVVKELSLQYRIRSVKYTMFFSRAIHYLGSKEIVFLVQKFNIVVNIFCSSTGLEPQILAKDKRNQAFTPWIYSIPGKCKRLYQTFTSRTNLFCLFFASDLKHLTTIWTAKPKHCRNTADWPVTLPRREVF